MAADKLFRYHQNLYVLDNQRAYRQEVVRYLNLIAGTYSGRTLLNSIYARGRRLVIVPYVPTAKDPINAYAQFDNVLDATTKDFPVMGTIQVPGYGSIPVPTQWIGSGAGSTVTLKYHPAVFRQYVANKHRIDPGAGPGEILFHEMVHAMRMIHGKFLRTAVTEDAGMDDFEEFCAILAANIYRSERGFSQLRTNHHDFKALGKDLSKPQAYYSYFMDEIDLWFTSQKAFCLELAASNAPFNPLKYAAAALGMPVRTSMALPAGR